MRKLETKRLIIRNFESTDAEGAYILFSDKEAMRYVGINPALTSQAESLDRVNDWARTDERLAIVSKENGEFIGYIAVNPDSEEDREDTRELGFATASPFRRKGYMSEALSAIIDYLRSDNIRYVWACCFKENKSSEAFIRKMGFEFQQEGTYEPEGDKEYESLEFRMTL